jgi:Ca-activated chloride channel family protein
MRKFKGGASARTRSGARLVAACAARFVSASATRVVAACVALVAAALFSSLHVAAQSQPQQTPDKQTTDTQPAPPHERPRRAIPPDTLPSDPSEVITVDTNLILVDVDVRDAGGNPVRNLRRQDFKLFEDGVERPIAFFNIEQRDSARRPVAVVFAVDVSGSLKPEEMQLIGRSLRVFSQRLYDRDSVFAVMTFGMRVNVLQNFTNQTEKLDRAFGKLSREVNGLSTHTYDAVDDALRLLKRDAPRTRSQQPIKRAVVVVTDGFPVGDTVAPDTVIERANADGVSIYTLTVPSDSSVLAPAADGSHAPLPTLLDVSGLVEKTGGANVYANQRDFEPFFKTLADELISTYVLAFYPPEENRRDGRFHQIRITAPTGLTIRQNRPGYKNDGKNGGD